MSFLLRPDSLSRRRFLRGVLGGVPVTLGLPILDAMLDSHGSAWAAGGKLPQRFGVFYWGGGVVHDQWVPKRTGSEFALPDSLEPFVNLRSYLSVISGTNHKYASPGHIPARGIALSSSHDQSTTVSGVGNYRGQSHPEPSIDALVAEQIAKRDKRLFDTIEIGICRKGPYKSNISWKRGGKVFNRHEPSPQKLFDRLFRGGVDDGKGGVLKMSTALEASLLDTVGRETRLLESRLGRADRERLGQHLQGVRSIERRLQERERLLAGGRCFVPDRPERADFGDDTGHEEKEAKGQIMSDLLAHALSCGMSRVFSYEFSAGQSHAVYWENGVTEEHHPLTHTEVKGGPDLPKTIRFIMKNFAYLGESLRRLREGAGNLLDNTVILGTSEHANAGAHNWKDHPFLLLGNAGGRLRTNHHHRDPDPIGNYNAPRVLLTVARAVGADVPHLGHKDRIVSESLSALEA